MVATTAGSPPRTCAPYIRPDSIPGFLDALTFIRARRAACDCLCLYSGGKDSTFMSFIAYDVRIGLPDRQKALDGVKAPVNSKIVSRIAAQLGLESMLADLLPVAEARDSAFTCAE